MSTLRPGSGRGFDHFDFIGLEESTVDSDDEDMLSINTEVLALSRHPVKVVWLGGIVVRALDLRLEIAGSIPAAALSSATLDELFTHIVQRL